MSNKGIWSQERFQGQSARCMRNITAKWGLAAVFARVSPPWDFAVPPCGAVLPSAYSCLPPYKGDAT